MSEAEGDPTLNLRIAKRPTSLPAVDVSETLVDDSVTWPYLQARVY
jgi:hypothetical protein